MASERPILTAGRLGPSKTRFLLVLLALGLLLLEGLPTAGAVGTGAPLPHAASRGPLGVAPTASPSIPRYSTGLPGLATPRGCSSPSGCNSVPTAHPSPFVVGGGGWVNLTKNVTGGPSARYLAMMTFDAGDGYSLLFGGYSSISGITTVFQDTWTFKNGVWTDITGTLLASPGKRYAGAMTYDPSDHEVVLFGGYDGGTTYYADTWVFTNGTWNQLNPTVYPTARWRTPGLAYDAADGYVVLFGGSDSSNNALSDTWEFVGNAWTKLSPTGAPVGRCRAGEVYDANDSEIVVFGGDTSCTSSSGTFDTWVYSAGAWKMLTLTTHPISRVYPQLVYDPAESAVILFGGAMASGGTTNYQDTWKFTGNAWTQVTSGAGTPPSTRGYGMTSFDPEGGYVFLFGGGDGGAGYFNDSWAYGPSAVIWGSVAPSPTDVGVKLWINTTTVTAKGVSPVTYNYSGLPTGCASSNLSRINCTTTGNGAFNVVVGVNTSRGITSFANLSAIVNLDPTITGIVMSPPQVEVGITTRINTTVVGGSAPFTYSYTKLPPGCASQNVSSLLCAPNTTGSFTYRVHVLDGAGVGANRTAILVVNTPPSRLNSTFTAFPPAVDVGSSTHLYANISGGTAPFVFTWSGLPSGCSAANASTLLCAPIVPGRAAISVRVVDTFGLAIVGTINITVNAALDLVKFGISPLKVDAGVKVTFYANVTGGTSPYSYLFTGLPSGCSLGNAPTPTCTPRGIGSFLVTAKVSDGAFVSVSKSLTLTIVPDPTVTAFNASPTRLDVGQSVNLNVATQNGTAPLNFSYSGLPAGCQGSYSNSFTCSPLVAGVFPVTVTARDAWKVSSSASLNLTVAPKPKITSFSLTPNSLAPGGNLLVNVSVGGGTAPYSFHYTGLPGGCRSQNLSHFTCQPTVQGTFNVVVTVTDGVGLAVIGNNSLSVQSPGSGSTTFSLGSPLGIGVLAAVIVIAGGAGGFLVWRRRKNPPAAAPATEEA